MMTTDLSLARRSNMSVTIPLLRPACFHGTDSDKFPCLQKITVKKMTLVTNSFLRSLSFFSWPRNFPHFMETGSSLPCSQEPVNRPHPEPDQPSPRHSPHLVSGRTVFILPSHLRLGLPSGLLPSGLQTKPYMNFSSPVTLSGNQRNWSTVNTSIGHKGTV
jgi:hypothetical protein